tara:strand:- start:1915 stop:2217 length:303 start_codon:yes stop_codon:yes gene_type:complete
MATNLKAINEFPHFETVTIDTNLTEIQLPSEARSVKIGSQTLIVYVFQNGGTDGGSQPSNFIFIPANNVLPIQLGIGMQRRNIFVAAKTGSGDVHIMLEE